MGGGRMKIQTLTHAELLANLAYDPSTGLFTWITKRSGVKRAVAGCKMGAGKRRKEQWMIGLLGRAYIRGRLAWFYMTGEWPIEIDHRDGDRMNDRWANLREATRAQNEANKSVRRNNKLGIKGVDIFEGKFRAQIYRGRKYMLGSFSTLEEAAEAYAQAARDFDGDFARVR
jgi:hypothetical protein